MRVGRIGRRAFTAALATLLTITASSVFAQDGTTPKPRKLVLGEIESLSITDVNDPASGGLIVVGGKYIAIPTNLLIGIPSGRLALRDLVLHAPEECRSQGQSGLAVSDTCRKDKTPAMARLMVQPDSAGNLVADVVMIQTDSTRTLARIKPQSVKGIRFQAQAAARQSREPRK